MNRQLLIRFLLGLSLLAGDRVRCQTGEEVLTKLAAQSVQSENFRPKPDAKESKEQIMAHEDQWELVTLSGAIEMQVVLQEIKKVGNNLAVPGAINFYQGEATFGKKAKFHKTYEHVSWRPFLWNFDLRGFAEMCFLDPYQFDRTNYKLEFSGEDMLLGRRCWVYLVTFKEHSKGWHFKGTIWVLPDDLTIIRFEGAFHPMRKILWFFLVEDYWFFFDSWRKEILPGKWVPDFTCTGADLAGSDFTKLAFRARITFVNGNGDRPSAASENACKMEGREFPRRTMQPGPNSGSSRQ
jgi:hypothetical protein